MNIKSGHQITVKEGDQVFLKAHDVKKCDDFDQHLKAGLASTVLHLCHNLVGECAYRCKELIHRKGKSLEVPRQVLELTDESESELGRTHSPSWSAPATVQAHKCKPSSEPAEHLKDTRRQHALPQSPSLGSQYTASPSPRPSIKQEPEEFSVPQNAGSSGTLQDPIVLDIDSEEEDWDDGEDTKS